MKRGFRRNKYPSGRIGFDQRRTRAIFDPMSNYCLETTNLSHRWHACTPVHVIRHEAMYPLDDYETRKLLAVVDCFMLDFEIPMKRYTRAYWRLVARRLCFHSQVRFVGALYAVLDRANRLCRFHPDFLRLRRAIADGYASLRLSSGAHLSS